MLVVKDQSIQFKKTMLNHVSFRVLDSFIMVIDGKSGSGKSSLLKFIMNEIEYQLGILMYNGEKINDKNREYFLFQHVCYIDQAGSYFPNMSIAQHFSFYCQLYKLIDYEKRM